MGWNQSQDVGLLELPLIGPASNHVRAEQTTTADWSVQAVLQLGGSSGSSLLGPSRHELTGTGRR